MKRHLLTLIALCILHVSIAQEVKVIHQSEQKFKKTKNKHPFHFLEAESDTVHMNYIATLEVNGLNSPNLYNMFKRMKEVAKRMGANAFKLRRYSHATVHLVVDVYRATEEAIEKNNTLKPKNTIFVFAGGPFERSGYYTFEMNGIAKSLKNGTYFKYGLHEGEQVKLKKGTVTGTVMWVKWKPNQLPNYYSIHGFSDEAVVKRTTQSESFKSGKFAPVESGLAGLLVAVLDEKE